MPKDVTATASRLAMELLAASDPHEISKLIENRIAGLDPEAQDDVVGALSQCFVDYVYANPHKAQLSIERIFSIADAVARRRIRARGLRCQAQLVAIRDGDYGRALVYYEEAVEILEAEQDDLAKAKLDVTRVAVLGNVGRLDDALAVSEHASVVLASASAWYSLAMLRLNTAVALMHSNCFDEAMELLEEAERLFEEVGPEAQASKLTSAVNRALCLAEVGSYRQALSLGQRLIEDCDRAGLGGLRDTQRLNTAQVRYCIGEYTQALHLLDQLRADAAESDQSQLLSMAALSSADCLLLLGRYAEALQLCEGQVTSLEDRQDLRSSAQARYNMGLALAGLGRYAEATAELSRARQDLVGIDNKYWIAATDWVAARIALDSGDVSNALELGQRSVEEFARTDSSAAHESFLARVLVVRAKMLVGQSDQANEEIGQLRDYARIKGASWQFQVKLLEAEIDLSGDRVAQAIEQYRAAIDLLEQVQVDVALELRAGFLSDRGSCYLQLISLLLARGADAEALEYVERSKARALIAQLQLALEPRVRALNTEDDPVTRSINEMLEERGRLIYAIRRRAAQFEEDSNPSEHSTDLPLELATVESQLRDAWRQLVVRDSEYSRQRSIRETHYEPPQQHLGENEVLIEYFAVERGYVAFVVTRDRVRSVPITLTPSRLRQLLSRLTLNQSLLHAKATTAPVAGLKAHARKVYDELHAELIRPVQGFISADSQLTVVPHGLLHQIPWSSLHDGERHLIEAHDLAVLPSASSMPFLNDRVGSGAGLVAFGYDCGGQLPDAPAEAQEIADGWGGRAVLGNDATVSEAVKALAGSEIVHFATHAIQHPNDPLLSGIELADGWLTSLDIHRLRCASPLVVLSSCRSGENRAEQGEALRGLLHALLCAGARATIAPMRPIDDRATRDLMRGLYPALKETERPVAALRLAMCGLMERGGPDPLVLERLDGFQVMARTGS